MGVRESRQDAIRSIVSERKVRTQQELAELLREAGFDCTQSTVSRDIAEIGLVRNSDKCYALPFEMRRLFRLLDELEVSAQAAGNIVVMHTADGAAAGVAGALDKVGFKGVLGTVAGDDTIFMVARTPEDALGIQNWINRR